MNPIDPSSPRLTSGFSPRARVYGGGVLRLVLSILGITACGTEPGARVDPTDVSPAPSVFTSDGASGSSTGSSSSALANSSQGSSPSAPSTRETSDVGPGSTAQASSASTSTAQTHTSSPATDDETATDISAATSTADEDQSSGATSDTGNGVTSEGSLGDITVFLAGDSTVSQYADTASERDQAGWGQMFHEYLAAQAKVDNRAIGGRTARRFIDDGALAEIAQDLKAGDVLMVQFGTNDGNRNATYDLNGMQIPYYLDPATDFKTYLNEYIDVAFERDATPILVTPPPRNSAYCTGGNGTGGHAQAMRELGAERGVTVADLNTRSVEYLAAICPAPTPEDFFMLRADGSVDGTHFQENGARLLAGFVAAGVSASTTRLAAYVELPQ